jgi:3D (Asp-Asp-Asp) domain-containing protein
MRDSLRTFTLLLSLLLLSCSETEDKYIWKSVEVTATAYNSVPSQTQGNPVIAAWGDSLKLNVPSIAVSRNLIALGLKHNTPVKIEGFDSIFLVNDKMHRRWLNRIDIYMGTDIKKAKDWGKQKLTIQYGVLKDTMNLEQEAK